MSETDEIRRKATERGVLRLCHFTRLESLDQILDQGEISSRQRLANRNAHFQPNDHERLDGFTDCISLTVQYPNAWLLDKFRQRYPAINSWVVLAVAPKLLWRPGVLFCPKNAASNHAAIRPGLASFRRLFDESGWWRAENHLASCPSNNQAELLVKDRIGLEDLKGIIVSSDTDAKAVHTCLESSVMAHVAVAVEPVFFDKHLLRDQIRSGSEIRLRAV